jgi:hypothetical protein
MDQGGATMPERIGQIARLLVAMSVVWIMATAPAQTQSLSAAEAEAIAQEAYIFLYPLITMEVSRRQLTNIEPGKMVGRGPMNTFTHIREFPDAKFKEVVRPNFDTLYSLFFRLAGPDEGANDRIGARHARSLLPLAHA